SFDEKSWKLRLETGPIRNLVQSVAGSLFGRPEFIHIHRHGELVGKARRQWKFEFSRSFPEVFESREFLMQIFAPLILFRK
ncbi:MAG: hypothetical protein JWM99_4463, partial [Verrucomicrobiales bacterium]|nr:hypothetical protein [Verrucomicrobiales bacterium]